MKTNQDKQTELLDLLDKKSLPVNFESASRLSIVSETEEGAFDLFFYPIFYMN